MGTTDHKYASPFIVKEYRSVQDNLRIESFANTHDMYIWEVEELLSKYKTEPKKAQNFLKSTTQPCS